MDKIKYGLLRGATKYSSRSFVDYDYVDKLDKKSRAWLANFTAEYYQNTFDKITDLHATDAQRRACYRTYNSRYRDIWNQGLRDYGHFSGGSENE